MRGILRRLEEEIKSWNIPNYISNSLFLFFAFILSTAIHEFGHFIVGRLVGCQTSIISIHLLQGATGFACAFTGFDLMWRQILIGYAGGFIVIIVGMALWFSEGKGDFEKNELSSIRLFCIVLFFLSALFQLIPCYLGLDGYYVVAVGMPLLAAWAIWIGLVSLVANIIISEPKKEIKKESSHS